MLALEPVPVEPVAALEWHSVSEEGLESALALDASLVLISCVIFALPFFTV